MRSLGIYGLVGLLSIGISGSTAFIIVKNQLSQKGNTEDPFVPPEPTVETNKDKFLGNLAAGQYLTISDCNLKINDSLNKISPIDLTFNGSIDYLNIQDIKANGNIKLNYSLINENFDFTYQGGDKIYFSYADKFYQADFSNLTNDILEFLPVINVTLPSFALPEIDIISLLQEYTDKAIETQTQNGFDFTYTIPNLTIKDFALKNCSFTMHTDTNFLLTGISTPKDSPILLNNFEISLDANILASKESSFDNITNTEDYNSVDGITNILSTLKNIISTKQVSTNFEISLKNSKNVTKFDGILNADFSNVNDTLNTGKYEISLRHLDETQELNNINLMFDEQTAYLKLNDFIKGKLSESTISDIIKIIEKEINVPQVQTSFSAIDKIFAGSDFEKLLQGDLSVYKNFINDFNVKNNVFTIKINAKAFGFNDFILEIILDLNDDKLNSIKINGIEIQNNVIDLTLNINEKAEFTNINKEEYKDYKQIIPLYNSISSLIDSKKFLTDITLFANDTANKKSYSLKGALGADLSTLDAKNNKYGEYFAEFNANIDNKEHYIKLNYQNENTYINYDNLLLNSLSNVEFTSIIDLITKQTNVPLDPMEALGGLFSSITLNQDFINDLNAFKENYSLKFIEKYCSIDANNVNENLLTLELNLDKIINSSLISYCPTLKLELNTNEKELTSISILGFKYNSIDLSFTLDLKPYEDFKLNEETISTYNSLDGINNFLNGFLNLKNDSNKYKVGLSGTFGNIGIDGYSNIDLTKNNEVAYGGIVLSNIPNTKDQKIEFDYSTITENGQINGKTLLRYNDAMHIDATNFGLQNIANELQNIPTSNVLYKYIDLLNKVTNNIPLEQIFTGNYKLLLNNYIKNIKINGNVLSILLDTSLIGLDSNLVTINVEYDPLTNSIVSAELQNLLFSDITVNIKLTLSEFDVNSERVLLAHYEANKEQYIHLDDFGIFVSLFINTTERKYFQLQGTFALNCKAIGINAADVNANLLFKLKILDDGTVDGFVRIVSTPSINEGENGYTTTDFVIHKQDVYIKKSKTLIRGHYSTCCISKTFKGLGKDTTIYELEKTYIDGNITEVSKVTQSEMVNNIAYYLLEYSLNFRDIKVIGINVGSICLEEIYKAMNSTTSGATIKDNYELMFNSAKYYKDENKYQLDLNLGAIVDVPPLSFDKIVIDVFHANNGTHEVLSGLNLNANLSVAGLVSVTAKLNVTHDYAAIEDMTYFEESMALFKSYEERKGLDYSYITYDANNAPVLNGSRVREVIISNEYEKEIVTEKYIAWTNQNKYVVGETYYYL